MLREKANMRALLIKNLFLSEVFLFKISIYSKDKLPFYPDKSAT